MSNRLKVPFNLREKNGHISVELAVNVDPHRWGFQNLGMKPTSLEAIKGFPVCTATVSFEGEGYTAYMGWIQIVSISRQNDIPDVFIDIAPQFQDTGFPYFTWGHKPTLLDAPSMTTNDFMRPTNVEWNAEAYLVTSPDGVMSKKIQLLGGFNWGYTIGSAREVTVLDPSPIGHDRWRIAVDLLRKKFPAWSITSDP